MSLIYNATFDSQTRILSLLDKAGNVISSCEVPSKDVDDITKPLTFTATADNSSVKLWVSGTVYNTFEVDKGNGWEDYTLNQSFTPETTIPLNAGQSCKWRCKSHPSTQTDSRYVRFVMTGTIEASGNCNSMLSSDFENLTSISEYDHAFVSLFKGCKSLTKAPLLPAKTLSKYCCYFMFQGCESLKEVRIAATKTATGALSNWLSGVSAPGDFYCDPNATIFPTDSGSGIPANWRRLNIADYPVTP